MGQGIDAEMAQAFEVEILGVVGRRLPDHLELIIVLQTVGVFPVPAILGAPRRLHIGGLPGLRPEGAQQRRRMRRAGADLHVIGLEDQAAFVGPELLQLEDQRLETWPARHENPLPCRLF